MAAGPASRLGSTEPGDKTGPRPSPALALAQLYGISVHMRVTAKAFVRDRRRCPGIPGRCPRAAILPTAVGLSVCRLR